MSSNVYQDYLRVRKSHGLLSPIVTLVSSVGLSAVLLYRIEDFFFRHKLLLLSYSFHRINLVVHGIDILPGARIGSGFRIEHPVGIVIGAKAVIGRNCTILQNVTIGTRQILADAYDDKFPIIGNNVTIGCNSTLLGGIEIQDDVTIGAHTLVLANVPAGATIAGIYK